MSRDGQKSANKIATFETDRNVWNGSKQYVQHECCARRPSATAWRFVVGASERSLGAAIQWARRRARPARAPAMTRGPWPWAAAAGPSVCWLTLAC